MMIEKLDGFTADGHGKVIGTAADLVEGDVMRETNGGSVTEKRYVPYVAPVPQARVLSKTAFQDYAVSQLGASTTGMGRFTTIMDATRDSANAAVRFAFARYEAAVTFEKLNTAALTSMMVSAGVMTDTERKVILDNWPTS